MMDRKNGIPIVAIHITNYITSVIIVATVMKDIRETIRVTTDKICENTKCSLSNRVEIPIEIINQ